MIRKLLVVMVGLLALPMIARADYLDLTDYGRSGYINGAFFYILPEGSGGAGSGAIDSFVRIQDKAIDEEGYNTSYRGKDWPEYGFDENTSPTFTHDLPLSWLQWNIVHGGGTITGVDGTIGKDNIDYYEIVLDINESTGKGTESSIITVQKIEIYIAPGPEPHGYPGGLGTLEYELDDGVISDASAVLYGGAEDPYLPGHYIPYEDDHGIVLDYDNFPGSGAKFDMVALFPVDLFGPVDSNYFVLYSKFGQPDDEVTDGYEEWARILYPGAPPPPGVPEPGTLILLGSGLVGLAGYGKLRLRRKWK